jgi:hypothetical protein
LWAKLDGKYFIHSRCMCPEDSILHYTVDGRR